ncbi:MAG: CPBP family intramembrane metalloprotease [Candidatus Pristimantibacillus lignocellulolyticus]|uniref:CPBP family intramembrane metalloprotease n=1 Tax=Candidatus Pristimantibacillus lignocellulolyticus TaxID=2994561 RepID=A0A9J6ZES8_9BACL|nr:MAG: CPBP family intramembrane metalloprotease [Candidatus Pristimantibacillus lignocellulolyticus]
MTEKVVQVKVKKERPVLFSILIGILLTLLVSVASAISVIMEFEEVGVIIAQGIAFLVMGIAMTLYMKKRASSFAAFGFKKLNFKSQKATLFYIPLLIIALVQPIMGGFNVELTVSKIVLLIVFSVFVGYTEEVVFRGIIRERLLSKGPLFYIVFSSILFGILHMANALSGTDVVEVLLQVVNAFLIGLILALLIETSNNIWPLIAFHFLFDALAQLTNPEIADRSLEVVSILNIFYMAYGIFLIAVLVKRRKLNNNTR